MNNGLTCSALDNLGVSTLIIDPQTPATLYVGTSTIPAHGVSNRNIYRSTDGGGSWSIFKTQLSYSSISVLAIDPQNPSRIYAGTEGEGIFVYSGTNCSYFISPVDGTYSSSGIASDQVKVTTSAGCGWRAMSNEPWITVTSGISGWGNGTVRFSVSPNPNPGSRAGAMIIASQTFTVSQDGRTSPLLIGSITPNSGPVTGGTLVTLNGGGFEVGASVRIGGVPARITTLTSNQISAVTGTARVASTYDVVVTNPGGQSVVLTKGFTYIPVSGPQTNEVFVPIVLSAGGMNGSFFTSEMTLTNRGTADANITFTYTSAFGSGSGTASDTLPSGQQRIVPDAISYLRSLGIPIPSSGSQGGTLLVAFSGLASPSDCAVTVRTTTTVPEGRAGLAYAGIPASMARFSIDINPSQQLNLPDYVQQLREAGVSGIGVRGPTYAGALFVSVSTGDLSGITVAARTSAEGGRGRYGVFYTAVPEGEASTSEAWLFGLQQNDQNRSNLALINTGESDANLDTFRIELFDGITEFKVNTVEGIILNARQWYQVGTILSRYAPGTGEGYARITRTAGTNPFIAYAVINDGRAPGERSGDGAFVLSTP
jgi:hypothetical protein